MNVIDKEGWLVLLESANGTSDKFRILAHGFTVAMYRDRDEARAEFDRAVVKGEWRSREDAESCDIGGGQAPWIDAEWSKEPSEPESKETPREKLAQKHYKGVRSRGVRHYALIQIGKGVNKYIGAFDTEEEAARAWDVEAMKLGRVTNFKYEGYSPVPYSTTHVPHTVHDFKCAHCGSDFQAAISTFGREHRFCSKDCCKASYFEKRSEKNAALTYKGVTSNANGTGYKAQIKIGGRVHCIGYFDDAETAARAWDKVAKEYGRELNFPEPGYVATVLPGRPIGYSINNIKASSSLPVGKSGYRGVYLGHTPGSGYHAKISVNGSREYLGVYSTSEEAAIAYDKRAKQVGRNESGLNFPDTGCADKVMPAAINRAPEVFIPLF